jgi:cell division topological specificity factor
MGFLDLFWKSRPRSASMAKDRLSIIVARERRGAGGLDYLPQLKLELLQVLAKYEKIDLDQVSVNVEKNGDCDVLELNVVIGALGEGNLASVFP